MKSSENRITGMTKNIYPTHNDLFILEHIMSHIKGWLDQHLQCLFLSLMRLKCCIYERIIQKQE